MFVLGSVSLLFSHWKGLLAYSIKYITVRLWGRGALRNYTIFSPSVFKWLLVLSHTHTRTHTRRGTRAHTHTHTHTHTPNSKHWFTTSFLGVWPQTCNHWTTVTYPKVRFPGRLQVRLLDCYLRGRKCEQGKECPRRNNHGPHKGSWFDCWTVLTQAITIWSQLFIASVSKKLSMAEVVKLGCQHYDRKCALIVSIIFPRTAAA